MVAGVIAFAVFIDLKQNTETIAALSDYTKYEVGFALFTAAWISNLLGAAACIAAPAKSA